MIFIGMVIGFGIAMLFVVDNRDTRKRYESMMQQHKTQVLCQAMHDAAICDKLAEKLEIQADGGDSAGDFVKWAIEEVWKEADSI